MNVIDRAEGWETRRLDLCVEGFFWAPCIIVEDRDLYGTIQSRPEDPNRRLASKFMSRKAYQTTDSDTQENNTTLEAAYWVIESGASARPRSGCNIDKGGTMRGIIADQGLQKHWDSVKSDIGAREWSLVEEVHNFSSHHLQRSRLRKTTADRRWSALNEVSVYSRSKN
ncbi:hypothetical protein HYPSUDRAFT_50894 [Hypholoma sublateritium FD-334 SS-4]|uniref:Uncharacterized protein n=1 Tax=Hypholoma sublateritium (strain FD-334 SS-4) TaxID=945553 RepID=A0A0D2LLC8_HYPSF|nr:hypothetical protein HYPSUDRAFT_50894 [Hypholoma sublateritium FD-334 SS-4]